MIDIDIKSSNNDNNMIWLGLIWSFAGLMFLFVALGPGLHPPVPFAALVSLGLQMGLSGCKPRPWAANKNT